MENKTNIYQWCRRYITITLILVIAYLFFVLFFNDYSVSRSLELNRTIDSLRTEIKTNRDTLEYYHDLNSRLSTDPATMERVAREQYNMKRPNEDVYLFDK